MVAINTIICGDCVILDLCAGSGAWSQPYLDAGYDVRRIDILTGDDVRLYRPPARVYGVLAAPPCTHLAGSGARWWRGKGQSVLLDALGVVDACLRIVLMSQPRFWCLENPVGRLSRFLGKPRMTFNPCDYGDPWTKRTCLWGEFNPPLKHPVEPEPRSRIWMMSPGPERSAKRSITPPGFARAFYEANR